MKINLNLKYSLKLQALLTILALNIGLMARPDYIHVQNFSWGLSARQGKRPTMEDAHCIVPGFYHPEDKRLLVGLFDGHGGDKISQFVSENFPDKLFARLSFLYKQPGKLTFTEKAFLNNYKELNENALRTTFSSLEDNLIATEYAKTMGSTAVVAFIKKYKNQSGILSVGWLGDSRTVLVDKNNKIAWASRDHKPENRQEKSRIENAGGQVIFHDVPRIKLPGIDTLLAVSRAFGDTQFKQNKNLKAEEQAVSGCPEIYSIKLNSQHKFLILACDGIWDVISNQEAATLVGDYINKQYNINKSKIIAGEKVENSGNDQILINAATLLRDAAYDKGSTDNISVIIIKLNN